MQRATTIVRKPAVKAERVIDTVTLDHEGRHKRRIVLSCLGGTSFLLDLDKATVLNDGDALKLEDGRLVLVKAAPETLLEIRAENPLRLLKMAWHIGNRHTPAEITPDAIYIEDDHVLAEMVRGQGLTATRVERPFQPEAGAYDPGTAGKHAHHEHDHGHAHDHHEHGADCGCGHDHSHDHAHDHGTHAHAEPHAHSHAPAEPHVHGPGCGHDHAHDHDHKHDHKHDHGHGHKHG